MGYTKAVTASAGVCVQLSSNTKYSPDRGAGQGGFRYEGQSGAGRNQLGKVLFAVGRYQNGRNPEAERVVLKLLDDLETALLAQVDIDERHVGPQFLDTAQPFGGGRRHGHNVDSLVLEQPGCRIKEVAVVINDDAPRSLTKCHEFSVE